MHRSDPIHPAKFKMQNSKFANFLESCTRIGDHNCDDVFYVYADAIQRQNHKTPQTLEDAYGDGFLVIEATSPGMYCLTIGNNIYENSNIWELEQILFNWSLSEGYQWCGPLLPGEPNKRPQAATSGHKRPILPGEPIA
jgi:hypothetical protein